MIKETGNFDLMWHRSPKQISIILVKYLIATGMKVSNHCSITVLLFLFPYIRHASYEQSAILEKYVML